jgi:hypothetical protein
MRLDIWFAEDIRNALLAANEASAATASVIAEAGSGLSASLGQTMTDSSDLLAVTLRAYREGYKTALATVALAFGIAPQTVTLRPLDPAQNAALRVEPRHELPEPLQSHGSGEEP